MSILHRFLASLGRPQSEPLPGAGQVANSAGGYAFPLDNWARLDRFLILGSEGGTYYITPHALTAENADVIVRCLGDDGARTVARIVEISASGRAPRNDPALFALAIAVAQGDEATRRAALAALPQVARTGTHLYHFLAFVTAVRGWGRGLRRAVGAWYNDMPATQLAYQAIKYRQRDGWSHRDALRLAHPQPASEQHAAIYHWITQGWDEVGPEPHPDEALRQIWAMETAQRTADPRRIAELVTTYGLPWEALPTETLASPQVWEALLPNLPLTALLRNLARMTANGLLQPIGEATDLAIGRLLNETALRRSRIHPLQLLAAQITYQSGVGARGSLQWQPIGRIVDALDSAFYMTFQNVAPTGKRHLLALDVSGSMAGGTVGGIVGLTPRIASAAMALVTAATEPQHAFVAFQDALTPLSISPRMRLTEVVKAVSNLPFGGTDCALPMQWARQRHLPIDAFVIYTDSETWSGSVHPVEALRAYRNQMGIPAKLIVVGMTSNGFSIADPNDGGMLDVVGFDTATPALMSDFIAA
jgi:60 kDa SS-A/Ro ribonucleoprotein